MPDIVSYSVVQWVRGVTLGYQNDFRHFYPEYLCRKSVEVFRVLNCSLEFPFYFEVIPLIRKVVHETNVT